MFPFLENNHGISPEDVHRFLKHLISSLGAPLQRILLIPPDITRFHSYAGVLTRELYALLETQGCHCDILPALGTHMPMTRAEQIAFFGPDIPEDRFFCHRWREDTVVLGTISAQEVSELSAGLLSQEIPIEVNRLLLCDYDWILSIGQVVPHEVVGMANYTKNILVGCGGSEMISASHLLSVLYGTERTMGEDFTPVRKLFDCAQDRFLSALPLLYLLTVTQTDESGETKLLGLYADRKREGFTRAVAQSQQVNITHLQSPIQTCVVYLDPAEFRTAWVGNKAIYRTRRALAPGARLFILAPGFERFGEDLHNDALIRKYGYRGRERILQALQQTPELQENLSVVAHLAQGSADGKFRIIYCTPPSYASDIRRAGYEWADCAEMCARFAGLCSGENHVQGEPVYFIPNPALGLWVYDGAPV